VRCVYLIQSHTQPALLARLVATLRSASDGAIVVVHDASRGPLDETVLAGTDATVIQRRLPVRRGRFSCLEPYLEGVAHVLGTGEPPTVTVMLSAGPDALRAWIESRKDASSSDSPPNLARAICRSFIILRSSLSRASCSFFSTLITFSSREGCLRDF